MMAEDVMAMTRIALFSFSRPVFGLFFVHTISVIWHWGCSWRIRLVTGMGNTVLYGLLFSVVWRFCVYILGEAFPLLQL